MGRRKARTASYKAVRKTPVTFRCPNCGAETMKVSFKSEKASIKCSNCLVEKEYVVTSIDEPVDVFGMLIDDFYDGR